MLLDTLVALDLVQRHMKAQFEVDMRPGAKARPRRPGAPLAVSCRRSPGDARTREAEAAPKRLDATCVSGEQQPLTPTFPPRATPVCGMR
jgi:hypothetical protein